MTFAPEATLPVLVEGGRMNAGALVALLVVAVAAVPVASTR